MGDAQANRARCRALKRDGQPCSAPAVRNGLCIGHQGEDNRAWSVKGGKATSHRERSAKLLPSRLLCSAAGRVGAASRCRVGVHCERDCARLPGGRAGATGA